MVAVRDCLLRVLGRATCRDKGPAGVRARLPVPPRDQRGPCRLTGLPWQAPEVRSLDN